MFDTITSTRLLNGLAERDEAMWRQFCSRYGPVIVACARRAGLQEQDARDVAQEAMTTFLEMYCEGRYQREHGRLRSWLMGIAFNKIREALRRKERRERQITDRSDATAFIDRVPDERTLTDVFEQEWEQAVLVECMRLVRRRVDAQTFLAFELYALQEWPADKVAVQLGMTRNAVFVSKSRVLAHLREIRPKIAEIW